MLRKIMDFIKDIHIDEDILLHGTLVPLAVLLLRAVFSDLRNGLKTIDIILLVVALLCAFFNFVLFAKPYRMIKYRSIAEIPKWQITFLAFYAVTAIVIVCAIAIGAVRTLIW